MQPFRLVAPIAVAAVAVIGMATMSPIAQSSAAGEHASHETAPVAIAAGGEGAPPPLPSIVDVRIDRANAALERAAAAVDDGDPAAATAALHAVLANASRAWSGAKYVIRTTPPPPAEEARVHADASGDPLAPGTFASPEDTAFAVLNLQHDVVTAGLALIGTNPTPPVGAIRTTIKSVLNNRDAAIKYIHSIAPPPPPAEEGRVHADASGDPIVATWDTVMPTLPLLIADEIQAVRGLHLRAAPELATLSRIRHERILLNTYWPPVPVED